MSAPAAWGPTSTWPNFSTAGERSSAGDYLTSKGWDVTIRSTREAYAVNGFEFPEDELTALAGDSGYLSATLK